MTNEDVLKLNDVTRKTLFDKLPAGMATDLWFYIHLGNYGNTVCDIQLDQDYPLSFKLIFVRDGVELFNVEFDGRDGTWDSLLLTLKSHAREILGVA